MKKTIEQSDIRKDLTNVSILLTITAAVGIYLIVTTVIIAKDGVTFIKYAQQIEAAPVKTMVNEFQHPGFPWLILVAHKAKFFSHKNTSILSWIYCAQSITLLFRLFAIAVLYFIAKHLFGSKISFWGVLILMALPKPAEYGSDALSDWPHLFFLATGLLLLFKATTNKRWWLFGFAGLAAGAGYLIRPECAILVVLGGLWLGLQFILPKRAISRGKVLSAATLLFVGFIAIAGPYMNLREALFPKKNVGRFTQNAEQTTIKTENNQTVSEVVKTCQFTPSNIVKALGKLFENTGETLMWFFMPALFIGMYKWFKEGKWYESDKFFLIAITVVNLPVMIWLYCKYGYMSDRHTLPLLLIPILFVPLGLKEIAIWFQKAFSGKAEYSARTNHSKRFWFLLLVFIGVSICIPKLLTPIRTGKKCYRGAAEWLKVNTDSTVIIAVPDKRISFYAEREELVYENENIPEKAEYIVKIFKKPRNEINLTNPLIKVECEYVDQSKSLAIYRKH